MYLSFLYVTLYLVKKVSMEKEGKISLGGTIILLALFAQRYIFGQKYTERLKLTSEEIYSIVQKGQKIKPR